MDREKLLEINRKSHENSDNSIFLHPKYDDPDDVALPKLRKYFASRRAHPPECQASKFWDKYMNMSDAELLKYWHDQVEWKKRSDIEIAAINQSIASGKRWSIQWPSNTNVEA